MAFQSDNLKKIVPMEISHLENFLSNRQIMIEEKLLKCYAEETAKFDCVCTAVMNILTVLSLD